MRLLSFLFGKKKRMFEPLVRVMTSYEIPDLLRLDARCFDTCLSNAEISLFMAKKRTLTIIADPGGDESMVGYMMVNEQRHFIQIVRMAVDPEWRGCCIGSKLVDRVIARMNAERRRRTVVFVPETLLGAQKFFKACGFRCTRCVTGTWNGVDEVFYQFEYRIHHNLAIPFNRR